MTASVGRLWWCSLLASCVLAPSAVAQGSTDTTSRHVDSAHAAPAAWNGPTTLSGVYTDAQAARGKDVYFGNCRSCHSPQSHTGETFATWWKGKPLSELFLFVSTRMPKNDPGSLTPEDAADVVAYLLKMNAMPTGRLELYPDPDSLKKVRIEVRSTGRDSTAMRKR